MVCAVESCWPTDSPRPPHSGTAAAGHTTRAASHPRPHLSREIGTTSRTCRVKKTRQVGRWAGWGGRAAARSPLRAVDPLVAAVAELLPLPDRQLPLHLVDQLGADRER